MQAVHEVYDVTEGSSWPSKGEATGSRIVVIGCRLDREALDAQLRQCVATA